MFSWAFVVGGIEDEVGVFEPLVVCLHVICPFFQPFPLSTNGSKLDSEAH